MSRKIDVTKLSLIELQELLGKVSCSTADKSIRDKAISDIEQELKNRVIATTVIHGEIKGDEF